MMKFMFHNWKLKLMAISASVVMWFFVVGIENSVYLIPEPFSVRIDNIGKDVSPALALPEVKIYVNAGGGEAKGISKADYEAFADLKGLGPGIHEVPVLVASQSANFPVLKVDPAYISVTLAPVGEKEVKVTTRVNGSPSQGYTVKQVTADRQTVKVSAASNILEKINSLTVTVDLAGDETADVNRSVAPQVPEEIGIPTGGVKLDPELIAVTAVIVPEAGNKTVRISPVLAGEYASFYGGLVIAVPGSVAITGEEKILNGISSISTEPVDAALLLNRSLPLEVKLKLPEGVSLSNPEISTSIMVDTSGIAVRTLEADVKVTRESRSFKAGKIVPDQVRVTLTGPSAIMEKIGAGDVTVNLNLADLLEPGIFRFEAGSIIVPAGTIVTSYDPAQVKIAAE
jgi:YbbR domain-containing protein